MAESLFNKVAGLRMEPQLYKKESLTQILLSEFCKISRPATLLKRDSDSGVLKILRTPFLTEYIRQLLLKSVKTDCICIVFFFHHFKYYSQNIFSRTTVLYLIAKVERKE